MYNLIFQQSVNKNNYHSQFFRTLRIISKNKSLPELKDVGPLSKVSLSLLVVVKADT